MQLEINFASAPLSIEEAYQIFHAREPHPRMEEATEIIEAGQERADLNAEYAEKRRSRHQVQPSDIGYEAEVMGLPGSRTHTAQTAYAKEAYYEG